MTHTPGHTDSGAGLSPGNPFGQGAPATGDGGRLVPTRVQSGYSREQAQRLLGEPPNRVTSSLRPQLEIAAGTGLAGSTVDDLLQEMEAMSANDFETYDALYDLLKDTRFSNWEDFFVNASYQQQPWQEYLAVRAEYDADWKRRNGLGGGGGGPYSRRYETLRLSNDQEARAMIDQEMMNAFGRSANDEEAAVFLKLLNKKERKNPDVQVIQGTGGTNDRVKQVTKPGFNSAAYAKEYVQSQPGYGPRKVTLGLMRAVDGLISGRQGNAAEGLLMGGTSGA